MKHRIIIGLTGLIGSGKSLASKYFAQLGAQIIDTDLIAHELTAPNGAAIKPILKTFGSQFIKDNGSLDRDKIRNLVFMDADAKRDLEQILHGLIYKQVIQMLSVGVEACVVIVVPLLFKAPKYLALIDRSVFIDCAEDVLIKRVKLRSQLSEDLIRSIIDSQVPRAQQLEMADDIIQNNGPESGLKDNVAKLYEIYLRMKKSS